MLAELTADTHFPLVIGTENLSKIPWISILKSKFWRCFHWPIGRVMEIQYSVINITLYCWPGFIGVPWITYLSAFMHNLCLNRLNIYCPDYLVTEVSPCCFCHISKITIGKLYGRGSTDDKGPVLAWFNCIEAFQKTQQVLHAVNTSNHIKMYTLCIVVNSGICHIAIFHL